MKLFLADFTEEELKGCIERAYDSKFDTEEIAPFGKGMRILTIWSYSTVQPSHLKIWHLSILPHLLDDFCKEESCQRMRL